MIGVVSANSTACTSPPTGAYPYAYDNADNLTTNNGTTQQYNNADELCWSVSGTSSNACGTAPTGATTYGYNNSGDLTSMVPSTGSATCNTFDDANRLTQVQTGTGSSCTSPTTVSAYGYDGDGLRESEAISGTTTQFTFTGTGSPQLLQEKAGSSNPISYIYGPGGLPLEQINGSTTTYLHPDQQGSTRLITDSAGSTSTATTITYDPYGNVVSTSGSLTTHLMYTGAYHDPATGNYTLEHRVYQPSTGTFESVDPLVANTMQPYQYVQGNPLNNSDPSGDMPFVPPPPNWDEATPFKVWTGSNSQANSLAQLGGYSNAESMKANAVGEGEDANTGPMQIYVDNNGNVFVGPRNLPKDFPNQFRNYVDDNVNGGYLNVNTPSSGGDNGGSGGGPTDDCMASYHIGGPMTLCGPGDFGGGDDGGVDDPFVAESYIFGQCGDLSWD